VLFWRSGYAASSLPGPFALPGVRFPFCDSPSVARGFSTSVRQSVVRPLSVRYPSVVRIVPHSGSGYTWKQGRDVEPGQPPDVGSTVRKVSVNRLRKLEPKPVVTVAWQRRWEEEPGGEREDTGQDGGPLGGDRQAGEVLN